MTLLVLVASAAIFVGVAATALAAETNSTTDTTTTTSTTLSANATEIPIWSMNTMMGDQIFGAGPRGHGGFGRGLEGYIGNLEISSAYNQTINNILGNDSDIKNLSTQGYNITSIRPIIQNTIGGDGTITAKAKAAFVTLQNGASGLATVKVDITNAKVDQIVILTRTVIDKSTS